MTIAPSMRISCGPGAMSVADNVGSDEELETEDYLSGELTSYVVVARAADGIIPA